MDITIDINSILNLGSLPFPILLWKIFWNYYGWVPLAIAFLWASRYLWLKWHYIRFWYQQNFILLAVDVPRNNSQTPKAVENMFTYLAGAHSSVSWLDKWWYGKYQLSISCEIVSIEGYIQFLFHAPDIYRDIIESAVYSQYPDAEITEVNDYTEGIPTQYPDDEYDIYGAEFIQTNGKALPIKTYKDFEHQIVDTETQFKDPMASLMDLMSSLGKGEQMWYQLLLTPIWYDWGSEVGDRAISKIIGEKSSTSKNIVDYIIDPIIKLISYMSDFVFGTVPTAEDKKKEEMQDTFKMWNLKPKERKQIDAIQEKMSKLHFEFKMRFIYIAKKEVMNKAKGFGGFVGFMKQFIIADLNNLKPDMAKTATRAQYFFQNYFINMKKRRLMIGYKDRDDTIGRKPGLLNIEELATIWHFPVEAAYKAPLLQKTPAKKAEAPASLPIEIKEKEEIREPLFEQYSEEKVTNIPIASPFAYSEKQATAGEEEDKGAPPDNLPFA